MSLLKSKVLLKAGDAAQLLTEAAAAAGDVEASVELPGQKTEAASWWQLLLRYVNQD